MNERQLEVKDLLLKQSGASYLHGVTGSGKTEVYLHVAAEVLEQGGGVIFLVPEISLTPQMERRFRDVFGELVAVHHSRIAEAERARNWLELLSGKKRLVIGARSAIFSPVQNLQLVIVDEEGDGSYKQETTPTYDARKIAERLTEQNEVKVIFGSATPSLYAWDKIHNNEFHYLEMKQRYNQSKLPDVQIVNFKKEFQSGRRSIFSQPVKQAINEEIRAGNQVILFVNRRGYSSFVMCRSCSHVLECRQCKVSLTYHHGAKELRCHYCNYSIPMPSTCPSCSSTAIKYFGCGTQKVEEFFKAEFPGVRYARLDTDVTRKKGVMEDTLRAMRERKLDVLIGTQMISKGLDFSGVTLTVILMPDGLVKMSDYSSGEKAFQLFVQIAGRAGRAEKEGRVFLQTYLPDNDVYHYFKNYALEDFYSHELKIRRELMFPPRASLIQFLSSSEDQEKARENALKCYEALLEFPPELYLELYPPQKSPIEKIENRFRWRIVMKASYSDMLWDSLYRLRKEYKPLYNSRLKIRVDPENLL